MPAGATILIGEFVRAEVLTEMVLTRSLFLVAGCSFTLIFVSFLSFLVEVYLSTYTRVCASEAVLMLLDPTQCSRLPPSQPTPWFALPSVRARSLLSDHRARV